MEKTEKTALKKGNKSDIKKQRENFLAVFVILIL